MTEINIHQIYYDENSKALLDSGFTPLDNCLNERPDWYEYHPIRNFLLNSTLEKQSFYGFFSPKFRSKTNLTSEDVHDFIRKNDSADVVLFSPFFDQSAFFTSIFEHGETHHKGLIVAMQEVAEAAGLNVKVQDLISDSSTTVFCNYFVAKPSFWSRWLQLAEILYEKAEASERHATSFVKPVPYGRGFVHLKVFAIERLATLLLSTSNSLKIAAYDPTKLPMSNSAFAGFPQKAIVLDALKRAYRMSGFTGYMEEFFAVRKETIRELNAIYGRPQSAS